LEFLLPCDEALFETMSWLVHHDSPDYTFSGLVRAAYLARKPGPAGQEPRGSRAAGASTASERGLPFVNT
jgi:hypothetical protein